MIVSVNPATGEEIARFDPHPPEAVDAALDAAVAAQAPKRGIQQGRKAAAAASRSRRVTRAGQERRKPVTTSSRAVAGNERSKVLSCGT